ncbi:hypothetical protein LY76DRAFT_683649 [Colletotrichum caudatum]|nr:hypothetical protein LY76DRAFT_683649 [Colletotrichum caudatum]
MQQLDLVHPSLRRQATLATAADSETAEQPQARDLSALSTRFRSAVQGLTHEWGFLRAYATLNGEHAEIDPNTFVLPVIADSTVLRGADYASVHFVSGGIPDLDLEPWVVVVDAKDPASVPYTAGAARTWASCDRMRASLASCLRTSAHDVWPG